MFLRDVLEKETRFPNCGQFGHMWEIRLALANIDDINQSIYCCCSRCRSCNWVNLTKEDYKIVKRYIASKKRLQ